MDCKIEAKNWKHLLGTSEFSSLQNLQESIDDLVGAKVEFTEDGNTYVGTLKGYTESLDAIIDIGGDRSRRKRPDRIKKSILEESIINNKPNKVTPEFEQTFTENEPIAEETDPEPIIEEYEPQTIKWEQYQSTTTQDLISEKEGREIPLKERDEFKDNPLNQRQRALLDTLESNPENYALVGIQDDASITPGQEQYGQVLIVVPVGRLPFINSKKSALENAIVINGKLTPLSFEGSLIGPSRTFFGETEGADRTKSTHDQRVKIRHQKLTEQGIDVSLDEVAQMFESEFQELQSDRKEIEKGRIKIYSVKSVSGGHYKPSTKNLDELISESEVYRPSKVFVHYSGKKKGQLTGVIAGRDFQLLPRRIAPSELEAILALTGKVIDGLEANFLKLILGESKNAYQVINNRLHYKGKPATKEQVEADVLTRRVFISSSTTKQYNDNPNNVLPSYKIVPDSTKASGYKLEEIETSVEEYLLENVSTGFEFYKLNGKIVTDPANRYTYFEKQADPEYDIVNDRFDTKDFRRRLQPWLEDIEIQEVDEGFEVIVGENIIGTIGSQAGQNPGLYSPYQRKIYILKGASENIKLEEELHATTGRTFLDLNMRDPDHVLIKQVKNLLTKARKAYKQQGLTNTQVYYSLYGKIEGTPRNKEEALKAQLEFLARGLSNPDTRAFLQSLEYQNRSYVDQFIGTIVKLLKHFGIIIPNTYYGNLMRINLDLLNNVGIEDISDTKIPLEETTEVQQEEGDGDLFDVEDDLFGDVDLEDLNLGSIPELSSQDKKEIAQTLDYLFVQMIYTKTDSTIYEILNIKGKKLGAVLNSMRKGLEKLKENLGDKKANLKQFLEAYTDPKRHLEMKKAWLENSNLFNVEFVDDIDEVISELKESGTKAGRDFSYDGNEINHLKHSSDTTKALLKTIEEVKDGKVIYTKFGVAKLADFKQLFYKTLKTTQGSSTFDEMFDRLSSSNNPQLQRILRRLPVFKDDSGWNIKPGLGNKQLVLRFFQDMRKPDLDYYTLKSFEDSDGKKFEWILELNSKTTKIKEKFFTSLRKKAKQSPFYEIDSNNQPKAKPEIVAEAKKLLDKNDWRGFFDLMGIEFSNKTYLDQDFKNELRELQGLKKHLLRHLEVLTKAGLTDPYRQLSNDYKRSKGFFARFSKLVKIESKYSPVTANYSLRNAAGNLVQGNTLPNTFTFLSQEANKLTLQEYQALKAVEKGDPDYAKKRLLGNVFSVLFEHSRTNQKAFTRKKRNIQFLSYGGMNDGDAKVTSDLNQTQWLKMQINTMLKEGTNEIMRPETLTSGWAWKVEGMNRGEMWVSSKRDFFNQMKEYLKGELKRVNLARNLPDFKFYNKELSLFKGLLTMDLNQIKGLNPNEIDAYVEENFSDLKPQLESWFRNEYEELLKHVKNLTENDIDPSIRKKYGNPGLVLEAYLMNDIIYNIETSILFYGGVEWYKDFHKRSKGILSTGQISPIDENYWKTRTREGTLTGLHGHTKNFDWKIRTALLQEDVAKSTYEADIRKGAEQSLYKRLKALGEKPTKAKVKEILQKKIDNYQFMEIGDGQGWCTIDFYREFLTSVGNWNADLEIWYKKEVAFYKKYEKGLELTNEEEADLAAIPKEGVTSLKVSYYGTTDAYDKINPQVFDKFSLSPLIPSAIHGKKLSKLNQKMLISDIAYTKMQSGTKVSQRRDGNGPMSPAPFFDGDRNLITPNLDEYAYELYLPYLKEQLKTDGKVKKKTITSTQKRKLLVSDLKEMGVWIDLEWTPTQVAKHHGMTVGKFAKFSKAKKMDLVRQYQETLEPTPLAKLYGEYLDVIEQKTELLKLELFEELGLEEKGDKILVKSQRFFLEQLKKELNTRDLNDAVKDFIDLKTENPDIPFEVSTNKQSLQNLIQGIINKRLVRQKVNGSQLIQVAPTGYEALGSTLDQRKGYEPTGREKTFPNNAKYGVKSKWQKSAGFPNEEVKKSGAKSTHEAILLGLRTGTSRNYKQGTKVGDVINVGQYGSKVYARVTRVYNKTVGELIKSREMSRQEWSSREGWSEDYITQNPQVLRKYPIDFELIRDSKTGVTGLKFYTLKNGKTQAAETKLGMVGKWKPLLKRKDVADRAEEKGISRREALNELIKDPNWLKENQRLITYTGERIPVQGINSMEYFVVEEFLPEGVGPIIIPPAELVVKSGGDYDIDKETVQIPVLDEKGELVTSAEKFTTKNAKELTHWKNEAKRLKSEIKKSPSLVLQVYFDRINELNEKYRDHFKQFGQNPELFAIVQEEIQAIEALIDKKIKGSKQQQLKDLLFRVNNELLRLEDKKFRHFAMLDNKLLSVTREFMSHELNYHQLVTPISTDYIAPSLRKIGSNLHGSQADPQNSEIIKTTTNIKKRKSLLTNPRLLGIVAVSNTYLQQYLLTNAKVNFGKDEIVEPKLLTPKERKQLLHNGKWHLGTQLNFKGRMKSELGSQHINATVDGAKEDYLGDANYSMSNMGMIMYLQLFGVPIERIGNFINQPVIYELNRFAEMDQDTRIDELGKEGVINDQIISKRNAVLTRLFRKLSGLNGDLKQIRYQLKRKKESERTSIEQKILDSFDGKKIGSNEDLEQLWVTDLNLETPNYQADNAHNVMLDDAEAQVGILIHYLNLTRQAGKLFNIQARHNYDTSTSQSPIHARERSILEETIQKEKFMDKETLGKLKTDTPTKSFNIQGILEDVYAQVFKYNYPTEFVKAVLRANTKNKTTATKERFYRTVSNDLIEWIIKRRVRVDGQQYGKYVNSLLKNFSKEYVQFIEDHPEVQDFKIIQDLITKPVGNNTYFYLLQDSNSTLEQNIYIENLKALNEIDPAFTKKLVLLGFGQTGFNKTYFSWSNLIPPSLLTDILVPAFKRPVSINEVDQFMKEFEVENPIFFKDSAKKPNMNAKYIKEKKISYDQTYRGLLSRSNMPYNGIFVFGSNPLGVNGNPKRGTGGAALVAHQEFGVEQGEKMTNKTSSSGRAYGLVTVKRPGGKKSLTLPQIRENVETLFDTALDNPNKKYYVAYSGQDPNKVSLNGYSAQEIANQFYGYPENIVFEEAFINLIPAAPEVLSTPVEQSKSLLHEGTQVFRGKTIQDLLFYNHEDEIGGAQADYKGNIIRVNFDKLWTLYNNKGWTKPRLLRDGSSATALPIEQFQSYREWITFILLHEYTHFDNPQLPSETIGQYEDRINQLALEDLYENFDTFTEAVHPAKDFRLNTTEEKRLAIAELVSRSKTIEIRGEGQNSYYYDTKTGKRYERATHFINKKRPENSPLLESSALIGTAIDQVTRDYFSGQLKTYEEYIVPDGEQFVKSGLLFESKELFNRFVKELDRLNTWFKKNGEQVIAEDVIVFDSNINSEYEGVAGTVDLLTINKDGRVRLYDLKSKRSGVDFKHSQVYGKSDFEKWTDQLNLYRILLANNNKMLANELGILPIKVKYQEGQPTTSQAHFLPLEVIPVVKNVGTAKVNTNLNERSSEITGNAPLGSIPEAFELKDYMLSDDAEFVSFEEGGYIYEIVPITERIDFFTAVQNNIKVQEFNGRKVIHEVRRQKIVISRPEIQGDRLEIEGLEPLIVNEKDKAC